MPRRSTALLTMLATWRRQHEMSTLEREADRGDFDAICNRMWMSHAQFDLGCNLIGNHYGSATSALFAAVVLNRTMIFSNAENSVAESCQDSIYLKPWIVTKQKLEPILQRAGCNLLKDKKVDHWTSMFNFVPSNPSTKEEPAGTTRRCGYARSDRKVLFFDDLFNSGVEAFLDNPWLSPEATQRAQLLLSNPIPGLARFESYGLLLRSFLGFTNQTLALAKVALEGIHHGDHLAHECLGTLEIKDESFFTIGVHLRHKRVDEQLEALYDAAAEEGVLRLLQLHASEVQAGVRRAGTKCVILIASDRAEAIQHMQNFSANITIPGSKPSEQRGCLVRYVPRNMSAEISKQQRDEHYEETGPWAQAKMSVADWYLLTHADYFLGTADSTFSFLIGDEVAGRSALRPVGGANSSSSLQSPFLWVLPPPPPGLYPALPAKLTLTDAWASVLPPPPESGGVYVVEHTNYVKEKSVKSCPLKG